MSEPVVEADVSNTEFEAGLSLLTMMRRPSDASEESEVQDKMQSKTKNKKRSSASTPTKRPAKKAKSTASGSILLAAAQQVDPRELHDGEGVEEQQDEVDGDGDDSDDGSLRGGFRRNSQLSSLSHDLSLDELRVHFGKPIVEVAKEFGICTTFLKKICRRCGIKRWPHRQIRSLTRTIEMLRQAEANATSMQEILKFQLQIAVVEAKKTAVIANPDANGKLERVKKSVLNRSGAAASAKKAASADTKPLVQADLLHAVAEAAAAASQPKPVSVPAVAVLKPTTTTEAEATAAAALLCSASPRLVVDSINVTMAGDDLGNMLLPATTPTASSSPEPMNAQSKDRLKISPSHRKLLTVSKGGSESRVRSSSLGTLQDLADSLLLKPVLAEEPPVAPSDRVAVGAS